MYEKALFRSSLHQHVPVSACLMFHMRKFENVYLLINAYFKVNLSRFYAFTGTNRASWTFREGDNKEAKEGRCPGGGCTESCNVMVAAVFILKQSSQGFLCP